jgi:NADH-quinone oxidoreductase subunit F
MPKLKTPADLERLKKELLSKRDPKRPCVTICSGTGCHAYGCEKLSEAFLNEIRKQGLEEKVDIRRTGCHGFCERGTLVVVFPGEVCYLRVKPEDVAEIVSATLKVKSFVERLVF